MDTNMSGRLTTLSQAHQLLSAMPQNAAWCTAVETVMVDINTHIATAQAEVDSSQDPVFRQEKTNVIGLLISERLKMTRALETVQSQPPSLLSKLKSTLLLADKVPAGTEESSASTNLTPDQA